MDDALQDALGRSILETRHDPFGTPSTGGSSGSGAPAQVRDVPVRRGPVVLPQTVQSEGEGSVIPSRPPIVTAQGEQSVHRPATLREDITQPGVDEFQNLLTV